MPTSSELQTLRFDPARAFIIAEVAQNHDGSLGLAHAFIDAAARAGVDAIKFQTHIAAAESTPGEPWRVAFSTQDASRYDYWRRMEFTEEQWASLRASALEAGIEFLSSPFSLEAVELLTRVGVCAWKIASGEVSTPGMLEAMAATGWPFLISTGMSPMSEIDDAVERVKSHDAQYAVLQCTSQYPCPPERTGLNMLQAFRERYGAHVGLSDHSGTIYPALAAATLGAEVIEVHLTLSRDMFGPDVPSSVTPDDLARLVEGVRAIEKMRANPVDKDAIAREMEPLRAMFTKSVVARADLPAGTVLSPEQLTVKKPGTGIPAARIGDLVGRALRRDVRADEPLHDEDLESA